MFDIGFTELLLLTIIAMVVIGPEKLPAVARNVGRTVGKARRIMTNFQNQIEQEIKLDEINKKIMAETKGMDFSNNTIAPDSADSKKSATSETSDSPENHPEPSTPTVEQVDQPDQVKAEDDPQRP